MWIRGLGLAAVALIREGDVQQLLELNEAYEVVEAADADIEVLTGSELNAQLRVDAVDEAELINRFLESAIETLEGDTKLVLRPQRLAMKLDRFPCGATAIELHRWPVNGDVTISYIDVDGDEQDLVVSDDFLVDQLSKPARVCPVTGTSWPTCERRPHAVTIEFDCGFAAGAIPARGLQALRMLVGHWYENRETVTVGTITKEIEFAYTNLCQKLEWKA